MKPLSRRTSLRLGWLLLAVSLSATVLFLTSYWCLIGVQFPLSPTRVGMIADFRGGLLFATGIDASPRRFDFWVEGAKNEPLSSFLGLLFWIRNSVPVPIG
jgi:hypothetical protein